MSAPSGEARGEASGEASVPVDLFNPGQVFACLGLAEAATVLVGPTRCGFDWTDPRQARFHLRAEGEVDPVAAVLGFLGSATAAAVAPTGVPYDGWNPSWGVCDVVDGPFPVRPPDSPAALPAALVAKDRRLVLTYWGDTERDTGRDPVKLWGGAGGYPGSALARDALALIRDRISGASGAPFDLAAPQSSSFRLDWRRDYVPIDAGFSLNAHTSMTSRGFPLVELLGALGLEQARPEKVDPLHYRYAVIGRARASEQVHLPLPFVRAALGAAPLPFPTRTFAATLEWPAKEGQARCFTSVSEELS